MDSFFHQLSGPINVDDMAAAFAEVERHPLPATQMIVCDEDGNGLVGKKGTWFLSEGHAPKLIGASEDFDRIWQEALLGYAAPAEG
jgi:hypothetical protein